MGLFLYTLLFPGGKEETCRAALERKAENPDRNIQPENCQWHTYPKGPAVQLNDGAMGFDYAGPLSKRVNCPVLLAYIYDDDFWGYELWRKGKELDQFASLPDYFGQGEPPDKPGDAELLARLFGVDRPLPHPLAAGGARGRVRLRGRRQRHRRQLADGGLPGRPGL